MRDSKPKRHQRVRIFVLIAALIWLISACSSDDSAELRVEDPWARPTAPEADTAAFYATIVNDTEAEDRLVIAYSPRCETIEVHRTNMVDGVMQMEQANASELVVVGGGSLTLEPGALHVMCIGLTEPLVEGETLDVELEFDERGVLLVPFEIEQRS